jgi:hypothetical protein
MSGTKHVRSGVGFGAYDDIGGHVFDRQGGLRLESIVAMRPLRGQRLHLRV